MSASPSTARLRLLRRPWRARTPPIGRAPPVPVGGARTGTQSAWCHGPVPAGSVADPAQRRHAPVPAQARRWYGGRGGLRRLINRWRFGGHDVNRGSPRHVVVSPALDPEAATPADRLAQLAATMAGTLRIEGPTTTASGVDVRRHRAGVRRLAIIDLSDAGHQPMRSPAGRHDGVQRRDLQPRRAAPRPGAGCQVAGPLRHRGAAGGHGRGAWRARWAEPTGCSRWRSSMPAPARCASRDRIGEKPCTTAGPATPSCSVPSSRHCAFPSPPSGDHRPGRRWRRSSATRSCRPPTRSTRACASRCRARP